MATKVKLVADGVVTADQLTLTTASTGTNTTAPATTAFVQQEVAALVDSSPDALNTLNELAAALGDDANFSTTVTNSIATKLPLAGGTMTGSLLIDSSSSASIGLDRGNDTSGATVDFKTAGTLKWYMGLRGLSNDNFYLRNEAGSTDALTVLTNGNIGIGTSSPAKALHVVSVSNQIRIEDSSNNRKYDLNVDGDKFMIDDMTAGANRFAISGANVGIGTSSPARQLHVNSGTTNVVARFESTDSRAVAEFKDPSGTAELGNIGNEIYFAPAGVEKIRISQAGNLMIGATSFNTGAFGSTGGINVAHTQPIILLHETDTDKDGYIGMAGSTMFIQTADAIPMRFGTSDVERMRIDASGKVHIGATTGTGILNVDGGTGEGSLYVEGTASGSPITARLLASDGGAVFFGSNTNHDLRIQTNGANRMIITTGGEVQIAAHSGYELGFTGNNTVNTRADAGMFMLANTVHSDPYFGLGIGNNAWGQHIMMRTKSSSGTNGSATSYNAVSVGTTAGGSSLGSLNGPEPMAPFHILKGGLTMNGIETAGVTKYAHGNSDSGQWMHMNSAGRSGSGVGNFQLYIPTAVSSASWGSFGGDLFLSGYNGQHEYIIWRGYTNSGLAGASATIVTGTGSPTITVGQNGTFGFYINVSNISMTHPVAMYRVCKGGNPGREWDLSEISCRWY